jgi:hypothetical protein
MAKNHFGAMCCNIEVQPDPVEGDLPREDLSPLPLTFPRNINSLQRSVIAPETTEFAHIIHPIGAEFRGSCGVEDYLGLS